MRAIDCLGTQGQYRLIVQTKTLIGQGLLDAWNPAHFAIALREDCVVGFIDMHAISASLFGGIARAVGRAEYTSQRLAFPRDRYQTDADTNIEALVVPAETEALQQLP